MIINDTGAYDLANITGLVTSRSQRDGPGVGVGSGPPSQFESAQTPVVISGINRHSATIAPSGPSLEKTTLSGLKLWMNSAQKMTVSTARKTSGDLKFLPPAD